MTRIAGQPTWAEGVKHHRTQRGMSQRQLAAKADTTQATIARIENGSRKISDDLRLRIAAALDCEAHVLFPYEPAGQGAA